MPVMIIVQIAVGHAITVPSEHEATTNVGNHQTNVTSGIVLDTLILSHPTQGIDTSINSSSIQLEEYPPSKAYLDMRQPAR